MAIQAAARTLTRSSARIGRTPSAAVQFGCAGAEFVCTGWPGHAGLNATVAAAPEPEVSGTLLPPESQSSSPTDSFRNFRATSSRRSALISASSRSFSKGAALARDGEGGPAAHVRAGDVPQAKPVPGRTAAGADPGSGRVDPAPAPAAAVSPTEDHGAGRGVPRGPLDDPQGPTSSPAVRSARPCKLARRTTGASPCRTPAARTATGGAAGSHSGRERFRTNVLHLCLSAVALRNVAEGPFSRRDRLPEDVPGVSVLVS
jgi:hypothetical protein